MKKNIMVIAFSYTYYKKIIIVGIIKKLYNLVKH